MPLAQVICNEKPSLAGGSPTRQNPPLTTASGCSTQKPNAMVRSEAMRQTTWIPLVTLIGLSTVLLTGCTSEADRLYRRAKDAANEEGNYELALEFVDQAIPLDPNEGRYHGRRGDWLRELGRLEEALEAYDRAIGATRPRLSSHLRAISLCLDLGRLEEAASRMGRAAQVLDNTDVLEELDELRQRLGQQRATDTPIPSSPEESVPTDP